MFDSKHLDDLSKKLFAILPNSFKSFEQEIQSNFKEVLQAAFARLDLVTREEFDIQAKVLARTREKLDTLEIQLNTLVDKQHPTLDKQSADLGKQDSQPEPNNPLSDKNIPHPSKDD